MNNEKIFARRNISGFKQQNQLLLSCVANKLLFKMFFVLKFSLSPTMVRLFFLFFSISPILAYSQAPQENDTIEKIWVGLYEKPPYAMKTEDGLWDGISVDLWRQLADELDLVFEFKEVPPDSLLVLVEKGALDVALGVKAGREAEEVVDLSPVFFMSNMGVAGTSTQSLSNIAKGIFTMQFLEIAIWISTLLLIIGVLIWLVERRANAEQFGGNRSIWSGVGSGFWWAGVTLTTIGYGDKAPITFFGRALALLWMLVGMAVTASLTAAIISAVGLDQSADIFSIEDFRGKKVGVASGSSTAEYLKEEKVNLVMFPTVVEGLTALEDNEIDIFADDVARLRYILNENTDFESQVEPVQLHLQYHVFAWKEEWPIQEELNRKMLEIINDPIFAQVLNRYAPK